MGSETEVNKDLEVKKAHTRTRSKQKQDKDEGSTSLDVTSESAATRSDCSNVAEDIYNGTAKKSRPKRARRPSDAQERGIETSRKTRHAKRSADKKASARDENDSQDASTKRVKQDGTTVDEKDESMDTEEGTDDSKKPKKPSKRQLKKEKAEQRESQKKEASRLEATEKALNYVSKWKHARSEWKFEKLRQIWLMDNLLDDNAIPDEIFPTVLEYFEGCKGMAREQLLKKGMDVIRKQEENEEATTEEAEKSIGYKRARQLLQALPTET